jgi:hypothetical protein
MCRGALRAVASLRLCVVLDNEDHRVARERAEANGPHVAEHLRPRQRLPCEPERRAARLNPDAAPGLPLWTNPEALAYTALRTRGSTRRPSSGHLLLRCDAQPGRRSARTRSARKAGPSRSAFLPRPVASLAADLVPAWEDVRERRPEAPELRFRRRNHAPADVRPGLVLPVLRASEQARRRYSGSSGSCSSPSRATSAWRPCSRTTPSARSCRSAGAARAAIDEGFSAQLDLALEREAGAQL